MGLLLLLLTSAIRPLTLSNADTRRASTRFHQILIQQCHQSLLYHQSQTSIPRLRAKGETLRRRKVPLSLWMLRHFAIHFCNPTNISRVFFLMLQKRTLIITNNPYKDCVIELRQIFSRMYIRTERNLSRLAKKPKS